VQDDLEVMRDKHLGALARLREYFPFYNYLVAVDERTKVEQIK
jgi:hypothetical protein